MLIKRLLHIIIYWVVLPVSCSAQSINSYRFLNFGIQDGLPEKYVYSATEDSRGYLWFGTGSGLYRYDGVSFKYFKSNINKPGRTISNILQAVFTDSNGNLWLGSLNDLQWYDPTRNIFWRPDEKKTPVKLISDSYILNFFQDSKQNIWICSGNNYFFRFDVKDSSFIHYRTIYPSSASKGTYKIIETKNGNYYSIHNEGIYEFTIEGKLLNSYLYPGNQITNAYYDLDSNDILLTSFQNGIIKFDLNSKKYQESEYNDNRFLSNHLFCITKDNQKNTWIGSYPLFRISAQSQATESFFTDYASDFGFKNLKVGYIYQDRQKNLWICSHNGLSMVPWQNQQINSFSLLDPITQKPIEPLSIYSIPGIKDLLIPNSSSSGLILFDPENQNSEVIGNPANSMHERFPITNLLINSNNQVYALDENEHFFRYLPNERKLIPIKLYDQNGKGIKNIGKYVFDQRENVYINSIEGGCYIWNSNSGKLVHLNRWDIDSNYISKTDNTLIPCLVDVKGNIWFASNPGIYRYHPTKNEWSHFAYKQEGEIPPVQSSYYMEEDASGHIWITSINNGLYEFYFENGMGVILNYNKESNIGLVSDYLLKIKRDPKTNALWIASSSGLHRFDPVQKRVLSVINKQHGQSENDMRYGFTITHDYKLISLFYGRLNIMDLNTYEFNSKCPKVLFNSIKVQDREYIYSINDNRLNLKNTENFLSFEFTTLNFTNSNQNKYIYKLENIDKDWVSNDKRNYISFSGLQPGNYSFKVKAVNNDGVWSDVESVFNFKIYPAFWNTWWFRILILLLLTGGIIIFYRNRIQSVKHEEQLKLDFNQQINNMEMRALRAQMNPHFIFNSLNSIQKYILKNDHFAASQYLTKFSRLIRLILDHSNQNYIPISSEIELLNLYIEMESLRFDHAFQYVIKVDPMLAVETLEIPSMLIQPYVENAIWHGLLHKETQGKLHVEFKSVADDLIKVIVEDDGIGREKARDLKSKQVLKKKSYGMQITEDRISLINKINQIHARCEIQDLKENEQAVGTRVILHIPFKIVT